MQYHPIGKVTLSSGQGHINSLAPRPSPGGGPARGVRLLRERLHVGLHLPQRRPAGPPEVRPLPPPPLKATGTLYTYPRDLQPVSLSPGASPWGLRISLGVWGFPPEPLGCALKAIRFCPFALLIESGGGDVLFWSPKVGGGLLMS